MNENTRAAIVDLGSALGALYSWYSSTDIEALQTLLCIKLLADDDGYAQLVDVRREVGTQSDRMTRCIRLLMGQKKSLSLSLIGGEAQRQPLVDLTAYAETPNVKRVALTPKGREIVDRILEPLTERDNRAELESEVKEDYRALSSAIREMGFDPEGLLSMAKSSDNRIFTERAHNMLNAFLQDMAELSPQQMYALGLPRTQHYLMGVPGFRPSTPEDEQSQGADGTCRQNLGFSWAILNRERNDQDKE